MFNQTGCATFIEEKKTSNLKMVKGKTFFMGTKNVKGKCNEPLFK